MPTIAYRDFGPFLFLVHGPQPPSDSEWDAYLECFRKRTKEEISRMKVIVYTPGTNINAAQRAKMHEASQRCEVPVVVMSEHLGIRAVVTALSFFNPGIKFFKPSEIEKALDYLKLGSFKESIAQEFERLKSILAEQKAA